MKRRLVSIALVLLVLLVVVSACAPGPNPMRSVEEPERSDAPGFWNGLWHGIIVPVTFVVSLFNDRVSIYEVNNRGGWYDFGFVLGVITIFGGGGGGAGRAGKRD